MIKWILQKIVGSKNQRELRRIRPTVARITEIEEALQREPEEKLFELTAKWKSHLARYHELDVPAKPVIARMPPEEVAAAAEALEIRLKDLRDEFPELPASIAATPEAIEDAKAAFHEIEARFRASPREIPRANPALRPMPSSKTALAACAAVSITVSDQTIEWEMVHFDVQLVGGTALHRGMIAEMQTGEGKTLVATLPVYLNALTGLGVHVITVNDYLASRDSEWMGALFSYLGLTVGCIQNQMAPMIAASNTPATSPTAPTPSSALTTCATTAWPPPAKSRSSAATTSPSSMRSTPSSSTRRGPRSSSPALTVQSPSSTTATALIDNLVKTPDTLCNDLAAEAKKALDAGDIDDAGALLFKIKLGQPRNRQLMRFMEDPETAASSRKPSSPSTRTPRRRNSSPSRRSSTSPSTRRATTPTSWKWAASFSPPAIRRPSSSLTSALPSPTSMPT